MFTKRPNPVVLPEITFRFAGDVPPMVLVNVEIVTPLPLPRAMVPLESVPIKLPTIALPVASVAAGLGGS
jgi:hypothetical protein